MKTNKRSKIDYSIPPSTMDYDLFDENWQNRKFHHDPVLEQNIIDDGTWPSHPIQVVVTPTGKLRIISGHHRFNLAKKHKKPVYYVVDSKNTDIYKHEGSSGQRWSLHDHIYSRAKSGQKDYATLLRWHETYGIPLGCMAALLGKSAANGRGENYSKEIRMGTWKIQDTSHAGIVVALVEVCKQIGLEFATQASFVSALSVAVRTNTFDVDVLYAKLSKYGRNINHRPTANDYFDEIESLYNYMARGNHVPVAHHCRELVRARC